MSKKATEHPSALEMIKEAIEWSGEDGAERGLSLSSIKRYVEEQYGIDPSRYSRFLRRALVRAADEGMLERVGDRGKGASGSFRLRVEKGSLGRRQPVRSINVAKDGGVETRKSTKTSKTAAGKSSGGRR